MPNRNIAIEKIQVGRRLWPLRPEVVTEFAESICTRGVRAPITVGPRQESNREANPLATAPTRGMA